MGSAVELLRFLDGISGIPYARLRALLRKGEIRINGKKVYENLKVNQGDEIMVYGNIQFKPVVLYEDINILAVYKRKGIKTDGDDGFLGQMRSYKGYESIRLCHRLDTNTDGIVLFAKDESVEREIEFAFRGHLVEKKYLALVNGLYSCGDGVKRAYLSKDGEEGTVTVSGEYFKGAEEIETRFQCVEKLKNFGLSILDITLITGKTHQIRAHLKYLGHFVIGDSKYGDDRINRKFHASKQQLTSYKVSFRFGEESPLEYLNEKNIELKDPRSFIRIPEEIDI
jgi:23S rRNA pseudouridine955/2504/2580 synthase